MQRVLAVLLEVVVLGDRRLLNVRTPEPLYGHDAEYGTTANETFEHCCTAYVWNTARSGMPTAAPVLSLHCSTGFMLSRNTAVVPTSASEFPHAV